MHWLERQYQNVKRSMVREHPLCACQKNNFEIRAETVNYMNIMEGRIINLEKRLEALENKLSGK